MSDSTSGCMEVDGSRVAWWQEQRAPGPVICVSHPVEQFGQGTAALVADVTGASVVSVSTDVRTLSLAQMVDQIDQVRRHLGVDRWYFWGMSGGGWLSMLYARRHPESLVGIVIESVCGCFRARLGDARCALSPHFPAWRDVLLEKGMFDPLAHQEPSPGSGTEWTDVDGIGQVFRRVGGPALLVSPYAISEEMREVMPRLWAFDARPWLPALHLPTLVLCGTADPVVPVAHVQHVAQAIPGARYVEVEGGGHVPTVERSRQVSDAWRAFSR